MTTDLWTRLQAFPDLWTRLQAFPCDDPEAGFSFSRRLARENE